MSVSNHCKLNTIFKNRYMFQKGVIGMEKNFLETTTLNLVQTLNRLPSPGKTLLNSLPGEEV